MTSIIHLEDIAMALYSQGEDLDSIVVGLSLDKTANDAQVKSINTLVMVLSEYFAFPFSESLRGDGGGDLHPG